MKQSTKRATFGGGAVIALAIAIIAPWEGLRTETYLDIVGVATVSYGQTGEAARAGAPYTEAECREMLGEEVARFAKRLDACISPSVRVTAQQQAVVPASAYDVGAGATSQSTRVGKLNAGQ